MAQSPDPNMIENIWQVVKQRVKSHHPTLIKALKVAK